MSTLLMRLAAPMQAWGLDSKYDRRNTERFPTKSGVIGLVASALGLRRNECIEHLQELRFGVRIDREGQLLRDYHTVKSAKSAYVTHRYYLADAVFLAGLEGEDNCLKMIGNALERPQYPLFLGRRSCPPEGKLLLGIRNDKSLLDALQEEPWLISAWLRSKEPADVYLRIFADADVDSEKAFFLRDMPCSFDQNHRKYSFRRVSEGRPKEVTGRYNAQAVMENGPVHDPMLELEVE